MYITLLTDGTGGGWAFGPRPQNTPARVQPPELQHVTLPLCDPGSRDVLTVARATVTMDEGATSAFAVGIQPPPAELRQPAVLLAALPAHRLAVAIGVFADAYAAHHWWAKTCIWVTLPDISIGVYPLIDATSSARG